MNSVVLVRIFGFSLRTATTMERRARNSPFHSSGGHDGVMCCRCAHGVVRLNLNGKACELHNRRAIQAKM